MLKAIILSKRYWVTVCVVGLGGIIVFSVIEHFMQYGGIDAASFVEDKISNGQWLRYLISRLVGVLAYGMIMGYYLEKRKRKSNR